MPHKLYILFVFVTLSTLGFAQHTNTDLDAHHREPIILNTKEQNATDMKQKHQTDGTKNIGDKNKSIKKEEDNNTHDTNKKGIKPKQ